jgi:uncharacterized membrane protein
MTLAPLLAAPPAVQLHVATVLPAFLIGTWLIFFSHKGARNHRAAGYIYLTLMTVTAIAALFIHQIPAIDLFYGFGPIHIFSFVTLFGVIGALRGAWSHNIPLHRSAMLGVYIGGILIAGTFAFLPGRIMHATVFGG